MHSPVFQPPLIAEVALRRRLRPDARLYIDNGGDTATRKVPLIEVADGLDPVWQIGSWYLDTSLQPGVDALCAALRTQGVAFEYHREAGGRHNARAWGSRVERPLRALLPPGGVAAGSAAGDDARRRNGGGAAAGHGIQAAR